MPLYRHECSRCGLESLDLLPIGDDTPAHCGGSMRRLMPRRVVGRVVADSNGAHAGSGFAAPAPASVEVAAPRAQQRNIAQRVDASDPTVVPPAPKTGAFAKAYAECNAAERDARWHDTAQAVETWTTKGLEAKGQAPAVARKVAAQEARAAITKARADSTAEGAPA